LVVGFTLVACAVAGVAVDGARLWVLRRGLQNTVDAASLAAAARLDTGGFYSSGGASGRLDSAAASEEARALVAGRGLADDLDVTVEHGHVRAVATAKLRTSFLSLIGVEELDVVAEARAAPVFGEAP
jgi:hypothetical protein